MSGRTVLYVLGLAAVALFTWGIATTTTGGGAAGVAPTDTGTDVLAVVGGEEVLRDEVEATAGGQLVQLRSQIFDLTNRALSETINGRLLDLEAGKRGVERTELIAGVVDSNPPIATQAQIDSVYEVYRDQINQPLESVRPQIQAFLLNEARQARFDSLIASLRESYEVRNYLEPPRFEVAATGPAIGPENAAITIVEFSDFECPFCLRIQPTLDRIMEEYEGRVRLVFRQFPLTALHPHAQKAAEASLCADAQGGFWDMHDAMFENPRQLSESDLKLRAAEIGLDVRAFETCLETGEFADEVSADLGAGRDLGLSGTPALFINGRYLSGAQPFDVISAVIDDELQRVGAS